MVIVIPFGIVVPRYLISLTVVRGCSKWGGSPESQRFLAEGDDERDFFFAESHVPCIIFVSFVY